ncbi:MAG: hypothetical protein SWJ54_16235 [Cyanobacteriota bacterium]|nr:hypothetical protein [Cyanobacteriota bacterium]
MSVANLVIFVIAVAALALLVWQNLSPTVSLVFLGSQSPAFPLSFWIVMAIAVGVILALLIWGLFQMSATGSTVSRRSPSRSPKPPVQPMGFTSKPDVEPETSYSTTQNYATTSTTSSSSTQSKSTRSTTRNNDDWETEVRPIPQSWEEEDWGLDEEEPAYSTPSETRLEKEPLSEVFEEFEESSEPEPPHRDNYEVEQKPKRESWSGSVYSYGYREGGDTGVGKSESVYDADYRVITPPPSTQIQDEDENHHEETDEDNPETSSTDSDQSENPQYPPKS